VPFDGCQLVGLVADAAVVRYGKPLLVAHARQPLFVGRIGREQVRVPDDGQAGGVQMVGELLAEISISEERQAHAARS